MRKKFSAKLLEAMHGAAPEPYETQKEKRPNVRKALFSDYLKEWLDIKQKTCKGSTVKEYERLSKGNLMPAFGDKPIAELTRQTLQKYLFGFIEEGKHRTAEKLRPQIQEVCRNRFENIFSYSARRSQVPPPSQSL